MRRRGWYRRYEHRLAALIVLVSGAISGAGVLQQSRDTTILAEALATGRVGDGTHAELVARDGLYRRLADLQFREPDAVSAASSN